MQGKVSKKLHYTHFYRMMIKISPADAGLILRRILKSLRTRGKDEKLFVSSGSTRIIPACAGKSD